MFPFSKGRVAIPVTPLDSPMGNPTIMFRVRVMHILPIGIVGHILPIAWLLVVKLGFG